MMNRSTLSLFFFFAVISTSFCLPRIQKRDAQDEDDWSDFVGSFIQEIIGDMGDRYGEYINVDDFTDTFGGKLLDGKLSATGGSIGNLSTVSVEGLSVSTTSNTMTVLGEVKMDTLEISYTHFEASVRTLSVDGGLKAKIGSNLVKFQVSVGMDDDEECEATLDTLEFEKLEGVDVDITGLDIANEKFVNRMANMVIKKLTPGMKEIAEAKMKELTLRYLPLVCEYWSLLKNEL